MSCNYHRRLHRIEKNRCRNRGLHSRGLPSSSLFSHCHLGEWIHYGKQQNNLMTSDMEGALEGHFIVANGGSIY